MISFPSLTKRVVSLTTFHCVSFHTLSSALTRQSPSIFRQKHIDHHRNYRQPYQSISCGHSTLLATSTDAKADDCPGFAGERAHDDEQKLMQDMLYRIRDCNQMPDDLRSSLLDFQVDGSVLGKVDPKVVEILCSTFVDQPVFQMVSSPGGQSYLTLSEKVAGTTNESRTEAVARVMEKLKENGIVSGWRDELYPVAGSFYDPPVFLMERAATDLLGVLSYGVHINGILLPDRQPIDGSDDGIGSPLPLMWMARRSKTKSKFPSMLDHIVAGGQPAGLSLMENVIKECEEEAGIPPEIARSCGNLQSAGAISYEEAVRHVVGDASETNCDSFYTISRVVLFNYDLYLPRDFVPKPIDGEVEEFFLWRIDQIKESMAPDYRDPIKPNCYLVIIDYLLRMGYISPETNGYLDVLRELRSGDCR